MSKIWERYYNCHFYYDFIPLLPFQLFNIAGKCNNLFLFLKVIRLKKGLKAFDRGQIRNILRSYYEQPKIT